MNTTIEDKVELQRFIPASRERVYEAWTDANEMKRWFGPEGVQASEVKVDFRVGGRYAITVPHCGAKEEIQTVTGEYREIDPPARVVYTWRWEDDPAWEGVTSVVTIDFIEKPGGTEVRITHEGFPTAESRSNHTQGWTGSLDKLEKIGR